MDPFFKKLDRAITLLLILLWCVFVLGIFEVATLRAVTRIEERLQGISVVQPEITPAQTGGE